MRFDTAEGFVRRISLRIVSRGSVAVALALLLPWLVFGQEPQKNGKAAIRGTVTDATQAVVTGATAVLTNAAGAKQQTQTDDKGAYSFTGLEAGTYTLSITAPNFAVKSLDNIALTAGQEVSLDIP